MVEGRSYFVGFSVILMDKALFIRFYFASRFIVVFYPKGRPMKVPVVYYNEKIRGDKITIHGEEAHYLKNVLRLKRGHPIVVKTFNRHLYRTLISEMKASSVVLGIISREKIKQSSPHPQISLYLSLVKSASLSSIVQKITELGVNHLHPIATQYSSMKISDFNLKRYEKIVLNALKQSGRNDPLIIHSPINVYDLEKTAGNFLKNQTINLLAHENATEPFKKKPNRQEINLLIGPEGGISLKEKDFLEDLALKVYLYLETF